MPPGRDLESLQQTFWRLITAPEGAASGAAELVRKGELAAEDLGELVAADPRMTPVARVEVYADMYFYRLLDCLREDYPVLAGLLGEARFHNLVTDYLLAHPSQHWSLRELGRALPGFVADRDMDRVHSLAADLAVLEWERVDVFDVRDCDPLGRDAVGAGGVDQRMALIPALRIFDVDSAVLSLWSRTQSDTTRHDDDADADKSGSKCPVCVWRKGFAVHHRSLDADEATCMRALGRGGASLTEIGDLLIPEHGTAASARLAALLGRWIEDEVLMGAS